MHPFVASNALPRRSLFSVPLIAWLSFIATLIISALVWRMEVISVEEAAHKDFLRQSAELVGAIQARMLAYEQVLHGGVGVFQAAGPLSRREWRDYIDALDIEKHYPGIQGIGFAQVLRPDEVVEHVAGVRAEGFPDYSIRPAGVREEYTPILYLEPFDVRNQRAFGYDMFSEPTRRAAMEKARDTGDATLSGKVTLKQEMSEDIQAGFLMYLPLYRKSLPVDSVMQRRAALLGYVYSPFRVDDLMHGILGGEAAELNLQIFDGDRIDAEALMYDERAPVAAGMTEATPRFDSIRSLEFQGRTWTLNISSTPLFEALIDTSKPRIVAFSGVVISLLCLAFVWLLATRRERALKLAHDMTGKLREREAFINAIVDSAADGIITIDESGSILSFNQAAEKIFQYKEEEVLNRDVRMLMPEPYHSKHDGYLQRYLQTGIHKLIGIGRDVTGRRKDGRLFPLELAISVVEQGDRKVFAGIVRDITQRKESEEALRSSEERFNLAIQGANDGLWDWDLDTDRLYFSPRWKEMLGYEEDEIGTGLDEWRARVHPDDLGHALMNLHHYLDDETDCYQSEHRMRHKAGHYIWVLDRGIAQRDEQGVVHRMVGICSDISQRKHMEKMKSEFIATVSHELRTPLTSIQGSLGLIAGGAVGPVPEQVADLLEIAGRNSEQLSRLINDLLDIEKLQSGTISFQFEPGAVEQLVTDAVEVNHGYAEQFSVRFLIKSYVHGAMINVDAVRFTQVMSNLLSNAAKFSPQGADVVVSIHQAKGCVRIEVKDSGSGIPAEFREHVFEKFSQADASDTRYKGGTGLGLNISKSLVERMHGRIGFESSVNEGTTFYIILPLWEEQSTIATPALTRDTSWCG